MGKPVGTYITIECPEIREFDEDIHKPLCKELAHDLKKCWEKPVPSWSWDRETGR